MVTPVKFIIKKKLITKISKRIQKSANPERHKFKLVLTYIKREYKKNIKGSRNKLY